MRIHTDRRRSAARSGLLPWSCTRPASQRTRNSPCSQASVSRLVVIARSVFPVSGSRFVVMAVRVLWCTSPVKAGANWGVVGVFMPCSVPAAINLLNIQKPEFRI